MDEVENVLLRILKSGNPILFTGAGFDYGVEVGGKPLPMGNDLKRLILTEILGYEECSKDYKELVKESLADVCGLCEEHNALRLIDYLTAKYSNCMPLSYHSIIASYAWQKIYTTNIDDLLENTFKPEKLVVVNRPHPSTIQKNDRVEYIKLHGCVRNQSEGFVFSHDSYVDSMLHSRDYRFNQFGIDIQYQNFIFIGTTYNEVNLDLYLKMYENSVSKSNKGTLIFINPDQSIIFKNKLKRFGALHLGWTTEKFAEFLTLNNLVGDSSVQAKTFRLPEFYNLNDHIPSLKKKVLLNSNLYMGYEPTWDDIIRDWDFQNSAIWNSFKDFYDKFQKEDTQRHYVFSLIGKSMSGKSVYLKRLAYWLYQQGYVVLEYSGKHFDYYSVIKYCQRSKTEQLCILVDDASFYYGAFKTLLSNIPSSCDLIILSSSRPYHHSRKLYNIVTENYYEHCISTGISKAFADEISQKLQMHGYLGNLKGLSEQDRKETIVKTNDLPNLLYKITYGSGFVKKFHDDFQRQSPTMSDGGRNLLLTLAIFEKLELPYFPLELVTLIYHGEAKALLTMIDDFVKYDSSNGISLRNSNIATLILKSREKGKIVARIKEILINISPQVVEGRQSYWNEIEASLMKEKLLRKKLGLRTQTIRNLLFEIKNYYNDSYNFWIQIGISEQIEGEFDKALNHFRQAEAINQDSYMVQNAIARNFLKQANSFSVYETAIPYFEKGEELMLELIREREEFQVKAYSTHCYLYEKMNFYLKFKLTPDNEELKDMYAMLCSIINKTSESDGMSKHISNKFYNFLRVYGKTKLISIKIQDLKMLGVLLSESGENSESLFEDFEIDE